jgi:hypothetical protein
MCVLCGPGPPDSWHATLCGSVFSRPLFELPFHRGVKLTTASASTVLGTLKQCQRVGGVLVVAPEHVQSLQLK